jgi:hypothetical protein
VAAQAAAGLHCTSNVANAKRPRSTQVLFAAINLSYLCKSC